MEATSVLHMTLLESVPQQSYVSWEVGRGVHRVLCLHSSPSPVPAAATTHQNENRLTCPIARIL